MKYKIACTVLASCLAGALWAQTGLTSSNRNFPIIVSLQFHSFSLPFKNLKSNFANIGIGLGTEVSIDGRKDWAQQLSVAWYRNRAIGNGLLFYTQLAYRPTMDSRFLSEIKLGVGYLLASRPVDSYALVDGEWRSVGHKGRGLLAIPVGASLGYNASSISSFATYQFLLVHKYNKSIPIVPETLIQVGSAVHIDQ